MPKRDDENIIHEEEQFNNHSLSQLAGTLKRARLKQNMTHYEVAVAMGFKPDHQACRNKICLYETGKHKMNVMTLMRWARAVNYSLYLRPNRAVRDAVSKVRPLPNQTPTRTKKV